MAELKDKIQDILTETRMVLPGTQALLGFQLAIVHRESFESLEPALQTLHLASLGAVVASALCLMAPAAHHRIAENGEDSERFLSLARRYLLAGMAALAFGVSGDYFIVVRRVSGSLASAGAAAGSMLALLLGLWFLKPWLQRRRAPGRFGR